MTTCAGSTPKAMPASIQLTLFAAESPANRPVSPGSEKARRMTAGSGRKLCGSWLPSGPLGDCLRTLLGSSRWGSTECFLAWKASATPSGRSLFRLVPSMPRTAETVFSFWPTPTASMMTEGDMVQAMFAGTDLRRPPYQSAVLWATPTARDYRFPNTPESQRRRNANGSRGQQLVNQAAHGAMPSGSSERMGNAGGLNPEWICWLMGFPAGWLK